MADGRTPNFGLILPEGNKKNWTDKANGNFTLIDALFGSFVGIPSFAGIWQNSFTYAIGANVVDEITGVIWTNQVAHTTDAIPATFLEERTTNPTYWTTFAVAARNRGEWAPNTAYSLNDFVISGAKYAVCIDAHISGADFATDVSAGKWSVLVDVSASASQVLPVPAGAADANKAVVTNSLGNAYIITPIYEGDRDVRSFGVLADGTLHSPSAMQDAISWAFTDPANRKLYINGTVSLNGDLVNLHGVQFRGPGSIKIGTGDNWYVEQNALNTGFGALDPNVLYIDPILGSDTNSGIAPEYPMQTLQNALTVLGTKGWPLQGYCEIRGVEGVYQNLNSTFSLSGPRAMPLVIRGPAVDVWDNTALPRVPQTIVDITSTNPATVEVTGHTYVNGNKIFIGFAEDAGGAHDADGKIYTVANVVGDVFELSGVDGSSWAAYTGNGKVYDCNGNAPKMIIYGAGSGDGFILDGPGSWVWLYDIHFIGCGTRAGTVNSGIGLLATNGSNVRTFNVHGTDNGAGVLIRDGSGGIITDGRWYNNASALWAIHARYTFGVANPASSTLTTTAVCQSNGVGIDVWEGSTGHADGLILTDNSFEIWARRGNSQCSAIRNRYTNTGAAKPGIVLEHGALLSVDAVNDTWTGTYKPRIWRKGKSLALAPDVNKEYFDWIVSQKFSGSSVITPGAGEVTLITEPVPINQMNIGRQAIRVKFSGSGTWATAVLNVRFKLGTDVLYTWAIPTNASARDLRVQWEGVQNGFDNVRMDTLTFDRPGATTVPRYDSAAVTFLTTTAKDFTVTIELNAADTFTVLEWELERCGW